MLHIMPNWLSIAICLLSVGLLPAIVLLGYPFVTDTLGIPLLWMGLIYLGAWYVGGGCKHLCRGPVDAMCSTPGTPSTSCCFCLGC